MITAIFHVKKLYKMLRYNYNLIENKKILFNYTTCYGTILSIQFYYKTILLTMLKLLAFKIPRKFFFFNV